jgi:hypothetical protein
MAVLLFSLQNGIQSDRPLARSTVLKLFPYMQGFKQRASGPGTIQYKIGEIFGEI